MLGEQLELNLVNLGRAHVLQIELGRKLQNPSSHATALSTLIFLECFIIARYPKSIPSPASLTKFNSWWKKNTDSAHGKNVISLQSHRVCPSSPVALNWPCVPKGIPRQPAFFQTAGATSWNVSKPWHCCTQGRRQRHLPPMHFSQADDK